MADEQGQGGGRRILFIVLGIVAAMALLGCIVCGGGMAFCAEEVAPPPREPARIDQGLYFGTWAGEGPTTLTVDSGSVHWEQHSGSGHVSYNGTFAGISGQDIRVNVLGVTEMNLVVADPPHQRADGVWVMTVEGIPLTRE